LWLIAILLPACSLLRPPASAPDVGFVAPAILEMRHRTVAVLPFINASGALGAENGVADELNLRLGKTGHFRMIERIRIKELYAEQEFDPERVEDTTAARIGRLLGAEAVILGTVTRYLDANRPPEVKVDAFPILPPIPDERLGGDDDLAAISVVANTVGALVGFLTLKQPVAEVSVTVRMVNSETGEILWQARNGYRGNDKDLIRRRPRSEWDRLRKDVVFLTSVLCSDLVDTLKLPEQELQD
jgi:TolB-like protein